MSGIEWGRVTTDETRLIQAIAKRACATFPDDGVDLLTYAMDVEAAHYARPMDLEKFLAFDGLNFAHDLAGIRSCLDRRTGALRKNFEPRCALTFDVRDARIGDLLTYAPGDASMPHTGEVIALTPQSYRIRCECGAEWLGRAWSFRRPTDFERTLFAEQRALASVG